MRTRACRVPPSRPQPPEFPALTPTMYVLELSTAIVIEFSGWSSAARDQLAPESLL